MSLHNLTNQVLALAGVYQACQQVKNIAWKGQCDACVLDTAVGSIFKVDATNFNDVYNGRENINDGLQLVAQELDPDFKLPDSELIRYVLSLISIERKLAKQPTISQTINQSIANATTQLQHFGKQHPNTLAALADIYQKTAGQLTPRIMVNGERIHLSNENNASKIRTLLLAGLRSIVLWRQCGGSRLRFLIQRKKYFHESKSLLVTI